MNDKIKRGTIIQGAELINDDGYWNDDGDLIIPDGEKLGNIFNQIPHGRVNKKVPGIGATTLELKSERNSIVVVHSQYLAYTKSISLGVFYVGSNIRDSVKSPSKAEIESFVKRKTNQPKKIVVVADSLPRVINEVGDDLNDWFIMLDEIDSYQEQASFREKLELAIDYYLLFDRKKRCMVSATMKDFSNPKLNEEPLLTISYAHLPSRNIKIVSTVDVKGIIVEKLNERESEILNDKIKIVIAFNSITSVVEIIKSLHENLRPECKFLCSQYSAERSGGYFAELIEGKLPGVVNFITSSYFTGIDIYDSYHLIYVSTLNEPYTILSIDKMNQIYGRCRFEKNKYAVISESLIHDTDYIDFVRKDFNEDYLIEFAQSTINAADCIEVALKDKFDDIKPMRQIQKQYMKTANFVGYNLVREDKFGSFVVSYFNIDALLDNQDTLNSLYISTDKIISSMQDRGLNSIKSDDPLQKTVKKNRTQDVKVFPKSEFDKNDRLKALTTIEENIESLNITELIHSSFGEQRKFYTFFNNLVTFFEEKPLLEKLKKIMETSNNPVTLRKFEKAVTFVLLDENQVLKKLINESFIVGEYYSPEEVLVKINSIYSNVNIGLTTVETIESAMKELSIYFHYYRPRLNKKNPDRKRKIVRYDPYDLEPIKSKFDIILLKDINKKCSPLNKFNFNFVYK